MENDKEKEIKILSQNVAKLNQGFARLNSLRWTFLRGLLAGLGSAIGATIIAAIVIAILAKAVHSINDIPIFNKIIKSEQLQGIINNQDIKNR